jgi:hypothetical protein
LTFQELRDSKKGKVRENGLEILRRTKWDKVGHQEINEMQTRWGGTPNLKSTSSVRVVLFILT